MFEIAPLNQIISALSQTEKRYFSLHAKQHALHGKNIYLSIFELIAAQKPGLQEAIAALVPIDQWPGHKHYLFKMILKAMRGHEGGKGIDQQLREMQQDIEFLEGKRLFDQMGKRLVKAKRFAEKYERFTFCLQLLDVERRHIKMQEQANLAEELIMIELERLRFTERLDIQYAYIELFDEIFSVLRRQIRLQRSVTQDRLHSLLNSRLLSDSEIPQSFHAKSYHLLCNGYCHQLLGDFENANRFFESNIEQWQKAPHWIAEEPHQYQRALSNYLGSCQFLDNYAPFPAILARMQSLHPKSIEEQAEHFSNYIYYRLTYHMNTNQLAACAAMAPEVEAGLARFEGKIPESRRVGFLYNMMVVHLFLGKHRDAVRWLTKLINGPQTEVRQDLQRAARLFLLLLHHELGNFDLYEHLFSIVRRFLSPQGLNEFEELAVDFLKARYQHPHLPWPRAEAELFVGKLEALSAAYSDAHFLGIREFIVWAQAKTAGRGMV